jgi:hypothetical protein
MDTRKLCFGLGAVAILVGLLLAAFTPGGWFNHGASANTTMDMPFFGTVSVNADTTHSSVWPIVGYVLMGVGAVAVVVGYSLNSPPARKETQESASAG